MKNLNLFFVVITFLISCKDYKKNASHQQTSNKSIQAGEALATQYCGTCHQLPDPSLADTKSWETGILPQMGPRLGIFFYGHEYPSFKRDRNVDPNYYPASPVISLEDWQHIIDYYVSVSPDSLLPAKKEVAIQLNDSLFLPMRPSVKYNMPSASYIKIGQQLLIMCDAFTKKLFVFNKELQVTDSIFTNGAVTDIIENSASFIFCNTGNLHPNNAKFGSIDSVALNNKTNDSILFKKLMRPVDFSQADFNNDGKNDFLVCEFGYLEGALSWLEKKDSGYERHTIRAASGAVKAYVDDYNSDGMPDIWALFAQGDEGIFLFINKGKGVFDAKRVLRFQPSFGSSYFEMTDFNKDGFADIVYTCGDNADYSPVLKPYHGVYIFLNDGKNNFTQKYFYAINGCYKAVAKDFDNDGDLDIATISFFADFINQPEEGFVYLKNNGSFNFTPFSIDAAKYGRWLTMDTGDFDGDGKIDIALGNFSLMDPIFKASIDWKKQPPFLLLKNIQ